jgi:hypothetical protein
VEVHVSLNRTTYNDTIEVAKFGVLAKTDRRGYWEISLHANDILDDPNSFYTVQEIKNNKHIATHYIRVPSSPTYTEPIHIKQIETTPLPVTPPPNVVTGIAADNNQFLRGDVRLLAGTGIQLQQDNSAKAITIVNTGGGGGSDGGVGAHNLLSDTHSDTRPTLVQRGMLIVGRLVGAVVKWAGLALGAAGKFLKSTGTDVVWGDVDWTEVQNKPTTFPPSPHTHSLSDLQQSGATTNQVPKWTGATWQAGNIDWAEVQNKPSTFPPSAHTHVKADITDFAHTHPLSDLQQSGALTNQVPKWTGTAWQAGNVDWTEVTNKPATFPPSPHTHVKADITDFDHTHPPSQISPQGSGSGLDADTVDGQHASAFAPATHTHNAADVAAGQFGANTGGGDYSFLGNVGIGTTTSSTYKLSIRADAGGVLIQGLHQGGGVVFTMDALGRTNHGPLILEPKLGDALGAVFWLDRLMQQIALY